MILSPRNELVTVRRKFLGLLTMIGSKVAILVPDIFKVSSRWVDDLNIAGEVLLTPDLAEVGEGLICNV